MNLYFSDIFNVTEEILGAYGAFNISLVTDLPLFIDPFLLFNSDNEEYKQLHDQVIGYLRFLREKSKSGNVSPALLKQWYCFSEVEQNWLGFCKDGNSGRGLGNVFATALNKSLVVLFSNFGQERITKGSHIEKLCLIRGGIGRDMISDFTTNLIKDFLCRYTQAFAQENIASEKLRKVAVKRAVFDYRLERWMPKQYVLPYHGSDFVILTPKDILTKDETWINHSDMVNNFEEIPDAIANEGLREQINNYFHSMIPSDKEPSKEDYSKAIVATLEKHPELIDFYIKYKEDSGDEAVSISSMKVEDSTTLYIKQFGELTSLLSKHTPFYKIAGNTKDETREKIEFFKDVIENKGGHHIFYLKDKPVCRETDVHILFRLTWHQTISDVSREVNDGRGPADFKISRGTFDKSLVEFKLASNSQLKRNLEKQLEVYKKASDATTGFKVIIYFTEDEFIRVKGILKELNLENDHNIFLVDSRKDNKLSASKA